MTVSLREAVRVWARIGLQSFGGPAGQIALMHRTLVEERKWIDERRFLHALNFCMLLPGPEAQQLATYVGWLLHGVRGGLIAGTLFILPGCVVILGFSFLYVHAAAIGWVQGVFLGLKPAVVILVLEALLRVSRRSLRSRGHVAVAVFAFLAMFALGVPYPLTVLAAAIFGAIAFRNFSPSDDAKVGELRSAWTSSLRALLIFGSLWLLPIVALAAAVGSAHVLTGLAIYFSKAAVVTFGGAYAVLGYVSQAAVEDFGWLTAKEMIDGLGLAETTPGPLILVLQFVGFVAAFHHATGLSPNVAGLLGALVTIWVTFVPCFLWIFAGAPHVERLRRNRLLSGALSAVTAAVVGVIAHLSLWFASHALFDGTRTHRLGVLSVELPELASVQWVAVAIALLAAVLLLRFQRSMWLTLGSCCALGIVLRFVAS